MFGEGISRSSEIVDLGVMYGVIKKSGSWFSYDDTKLAQGRDAAKRVLNDNPDLADELERRIMEAMANADKVGGAPKRVKADGTQAAADADAPEAADLDDLDLDADLDDDIQLDED